MMPSLPARAAVTSHLGATGGVPVEDQIDDPYEVLVTQVVKHIILGKRQVSLLVVIAGKNLQGDSSLVRRSLR
jgi:hypothetical protein